MIITGLHVILWLLLFNLGIFAMVGVHIGYVKLIILPVIVGILFVERFINKPDFKIAYWGYFGFFVVISIISMLRNEIHYAQYASFMVNYWLAYIYFITLSNENNTSRINVILRLVKVLVLLQIPAIIIKWSVLGVSEKGGIGTLSVVSGSLSCIFSLFIIIILFSLYLYNRRNIYLWLIPAFILFSIVGEKRATIFFAPLMLLTVFLIFAFKSKKMQLGQLLKYVTIGFVISGITFYATVRMVPSLNPESKVGGRFDYTYAKDYIIDYTDLDKDHSRVFYLPVSAMTQIRRLDGFLYFTHYLWDKGGAALLFGEGAGKLILMESVTGEDHSMLSLYGIRYGGRAGFIQAYLQVGILGVVLLFGMFFHIFKDIWIRFENESMYLALLSVTVLLFLDSFIYSSTFFSDLVVLFMYFGMLALLHGGKRNVYPA